MSFLEMFRMRINYPRSLESWWIKGTHEYSSRWGSAVLYAPWTESFGSQILILKDSTLRQLVNSELALDFRSLLVGVKALRVCRELCAENRESAYNTYCRTLKHVIEYRQRRFFFLNTIKTAVWFFRQWYRMLYMFVYLSYNAPARA